MGVESKSRFGAVIGKRNLHIIFPGGGVGPPVGRRSRKEINKAVRKPSDSNPVLYLMSVISGPASSIDQ